MRYYVVECGYKHNFRFADPTSAAYFMANAAKHLLVENSIGRESLELVVVEEPDPEPMEAEEVSVDDPEPMEAEEVSDDQSGV
jgi:hypothetical protein